MSQRAFWFVALALGAIGLGLFWVLAPRGLVREDALLLSQTNSMALMAATSVSTLFAALLAGYFAKKASEEAARQADLIREARLADHRPWVKVDLRLDGPFEWHPLGGPGIRVGVMIENIGKTPALNVHTVVEMLPNFDRSTEALKHIARAQAHPDDRNSRLLLPGDRYVRPWVPMIEPRDIQEDAFFCPTIIGCVSYQDVEAGIIRQTAFCFVLDEEDGASSFEEGCSISPDQIIVRWWAGGFAN